MRELCYVALRWAVAVRLGSKGLQCSPVVVASRDLSPGDPKSVIQNKCCKSAKMKEAALKNVAIILSALVVVSLVACGIGQKKSSSPAPAPAKITFADINKTLTAKCGQCHMDAGTLTDSGQQIPLFVGQEATFDSLAPTAKALITTTDQDKVMPPSDDPRAVPLTPAEKQHLLDYINQPKS